MKITACPDSLIPAVGHRPAGTENRPDGCRRHFSLLFPVYRPGTDALPLSAASSGKLPKDNLQICRRCQATQRLQVVMFGFTHPSQALRLSFSSIITDILSSFFNTSGESFFA
jgi:hypothetical protein